MKETSTEEGRRLYGDLFWNYDEILFLHSCSLYDPRCDQGHYGPHFMNFHRAFLLRFENSLLAIDPTIESLPYWDYARDTETGDCFEQDCYIFSNKYFGSVNGNPDENHAVTDGLFAYWPIARWTSEQFGSDSNLNVPCSNENRFTGTRSEKCLRCCGQDAPFC